MKITSIAIFDALGRNVFSGKFNSPEVNIDLATLIPGRYFVQVNGFSARQFIKN